MSNNEHHPFMQRCFDLALLGAGNVSPNPMVGAVLVHDGRIIGEGWHKQYGKAHAEVNAVASVREEERHLVKKSTLYVSLEPCNVHGNTPPCTDLILREGIKRVVMSCIDQSEKVRGRGIERLEAHGVEVITGVLEEKGRQVSAFRNTWAHQKRPFIRLKFAQSANGFMGIPDEQVWLSNAFSKRLVHKMRAEMDAILVGTNTALTDDPSLTTRLWFGRSPMRIVIDRQLKIPHSNHIYDGTADTLIITEEQAPFPSVDAQFHSVPPDRDLLSDLMNLCVERKITSLLVEGGANTLGHFLEKGLWDEAWVFTGETALKKEIVAPLIRGTVMDRFELSNDRLIIYKNDR